MLKWFTNHTNLFSFIFRASWMLKIATPLHGQSISRHIPWMWGYPSRTSTFYKNIIILVIWHSMLNHHKMSRIVFITYSNHIFFLLINKDENDQFWERIKQGDKTWRFYRTWFKDEINLRKYHPYDTMISFF